eukprot:1158220-Pelagomonas_calceolata.AAC.8
MPLHEILGQACLDSGLAPEYKPGKRAPEQLYGSTSDVKISDKQGEDGRPEAQLEASQQQHSEQCKHLQGEEVILHRTLLGG